MSQNTETKEKKKYTRRTFEARVAAMKDAELQQMLEEYRAEVAVLVNEVRSRTAARRAEDQKMESAADAAEAAASA